MISYPANTAVRATNLPEFTPQVAISIAIHTAYVASQQGQKITQGIYMMDNMINDGSLNEGTMELHTVAPVGSLIGWHTVPIDVNAIANGTKVVISGFAMSEGNVFGSSGYPQPQVNPDYWIGKLVNPGQQTYQIQIKLTVGALQPVSYFINWVSFITAQ